MTAVVVGTSRPSNRPTSSSQPSIYVTAIPTVVTSIQSIMCNLASGLTGYAAGFSGWTCTSAAAVGGGGSVVTPDIPVCSWDGITCLMNDIIVRISLPYSGLSGTISSSIGLLSSLTSLVLSGNSLTSTIPNSLPKNLRVLTLYSNKLIGTIPSSLGRLTRLTTLYLGSNDLTGTLPSSLGNLANLLYLSIHHNKIHGALPLTIGNNNLHKLVTLDLSNNLLTNSIPDSLAVGLFNIQDIFLNNNYFSGIVSNSLCELINNNFDTLILSPGNRFTCYSACLHGVQNYNFSGIAVCP